MKLLEEITLNKYMKLKNRIVMAPLTRCFATSDGCVTDNIKNYYVKRSNFGLIITEATNISKRACGYRNTPGIFTTKQVKSWTKVTQEVKMREGKIFLQLWHVGRVSHPDLLDGEMPLAPSAIKLKGKIKREKHLNYTKPKAMTINEIEKTIHDYKVASEKAMDAGFDGVEIHGANGYLIDQFLHKETNKRLDDFGKDSRGRALFLIKVIEAISCSIGSERVGLRLSPASHLFLNYNDGDEKTFKYILSQLNHYNLAYVHNGHFNDFQNYNYLKGRASEFIRKNYSGNFINCGSYSIEKAELELQNKSVDMVAFGRLTIANPDLVEKIKQQTTLVDYSEIMLNSLN